MLRRLAHVLVMSTALTLAGTASASATPLLAFAATPVGAIVTNIAITFAAQAVSSWLGGLINPNKDKPGSAAASGVRGTVSATGDGPISFIMGTRATAGTLTYRGTWGSAGSTPNAYYVEERVLSDVPLAACTGLYIDKKAYTVLWNETPATQGYPLSEARIGGVDYAWFKFADGTQTAADSYLTGKFGSDANHPYSTDMIGRGQAKGVLTLRLNKTLWKNGFPEWMVETSGIKLYNPAKDTSVGGSGSHRLATPSTWEATDVLPVHIYNALLGIKYGSEWVWGGQNISQGMAPTASWIAAIAEASTLVDKKDGSTEKQFRGGFEVTGDMEPRAFIDEALKACAGRIAEIGGTFKMLCGLPASSVFSLTDAGIVATRERTYAPFPSPDETPNTIYSKYYEPSQGWTTKDVPPRFDAVLEAADGGRHGPDNTYEMVFSATQAQRLDFAAIAEARRLLTISCSLGPLASELEPLDMLDYTSSHYGLSGKLLLIESMDDEETYEQGNVLLHEVDPADHGSYDAATDELSVTYPTVAFADVPAVQMSGYQVFALTVLDSAGVGRRPDIKVRIPGGMDDVASVKVTVRLASSAGVAYEGTVAYRSGVVSGSYFEAPLNGVFLPATNYEVQFDEIPFSGRATSPSSWLAVTTNDVQTGLIDLDAPLQAFKAWVALQIRDLTEQVQLATALGADQDASNWDDRRYSLQQIAIGDAAVQAGYVQAILLALGANGQALADAITAVNAASGDISAGLLTRMTAFASPGGGWARYGQQVRVDVGTAYSSTAAFYLEAKTDGSSRAVWIADQVVVTDGINISALFEAGTSFFANARIHNLDATNINVADLFAQNAAIAGILTVGAKITIDGPAGRIVVAD